MALWLQASMVGHTLRVLHLVVVPQSWPLLVVVENSVKALAQVALEQFLVAVLVALHLGWCRMILEVGQHLAPLQLQLHYYYSLFVPGLLPW